MTPSLDPIVEKLKTRGGRGFTRAVLDAFKFLGFEVEDIEETQGTQAQSDLIVKAPLATNPYFTVIECTAVREGSEVGYQKLYQLGSNFPRYLIKYSKHYPSASYKMLVGRPSFSPDTKNLAKDETLLTADTLISLLKAHEEFCLSQDEFENIFQQKGEISVDNIRELIIPYMAKGMIYAWIYLSLLEDPTDKSIRRKRVTTNAEQVVAIAKHWAWLFKGVKVPDIVIKDAIRDLSSPVLRVLLVDGENLILSSLPFTKIIENMGDLGKYFETRLMEFINKAAEWRKA